MNQEKPNIVVLMTDQQRWDTLGCAGNAKIRTPHLDALAQSGVRFTNACTSSPICVAARMSFITGHRNGKTRYVTNWPLTGPVPELPTIMSLLLKAGYWTQGVGKMHFRGRHYGFRNLLTMEEGGKYAVDDDYISYVRRCGLRTRFPKGLRDLLYYQPQTSGIPLEHHHSTWVADRSLDFLREHRRYRKNTPFFLWSSWIAPHPPFAPCEPYDSMYDPKDMNMPVNCERPAASLVSSLWGHRARLDDAHHDPDRMRRIRALYYGMISHLDDSIGRILNFLSELGYAENTVVLFTSDHGDMLGDHGLSQKNCPYEPAVRIPFLLRWPGLTEAGRVCDDLVGLTDVLPTLIRGLGLEYPEQAHGRLAGDNLLGAAGGGLAGKREAFFIDYGSGQERWIAVRTRTHKYALFAENGKEELYDLEKDPWETQNLAGNADLERFRGMVLEWERRHGLENSFDGEKFRVFPLTKTAPRQCRGVCVNEGPWPKRLPDDEKNSIETYAEAFTRAISKETTLSPHKLSLAHYKQQVLRLGPEDPGGEPLTGTPWEKEWNEA